MLRTNFREGVHLGVHLHQIGRGFGKYFFSDHFFMQQLRTNVMVQFITKGKRKIPITPGNIVVTNIIGEESQHAPDSLVVQSVLVDKNQYTSEQAKRILRKHEFVNEKEDVTESERRFRQIEPTKFRPGTFATFTPEGLPKGIQFIGAQLKK